MSRTTATNRNSSGCFCDVIERILLYVRGLAVAGDEEHLVRLWMWRQMVHRWEDADVVVIVVPADGDALTITMIIGRGG